LQAGGRRFEPGKLHPLKALLTQGFFCLWALVAQLDFELPEYLPIAASANGMVADVPPRERRSPPPRHLSGLLSQVLLTYAVDLERESELSLSLSANFSRVLDEWGVDVTELPLRTGVSKEAIGMALTCLAKAGWVVVQDKAVRLTEEGREAQRRLPRLHEEIEKGWQRRFGEDAPPRLYSSLSRVLDQREALSRGLEPPESGWRASKPYAERTKAVLADPTGALPHYPMVLHRGGWPDGS
jgi:DNA-binding MarR family transcriptional regulator